jgi:hypothetical protein
MYVGCLEVHYGRGTIPTTSDAAIARIKGSKNNVKKTWVDDVIENKYKVEGDNERLKRFGMEILDLDHCGYFFWAKDKSTLLKGFSAHDAGLLIKSQVVVFSGPYLGDVEAVNRSQRFGGSFTLKRNYQKQGAEHVTLAEARNLINRHVLNQKGYFVFIADNAELGPTPNGVRVIATGAHSLKALRPFLARE